MSLIITWLCATFALLIVAQAISKPIRLPLPTVQLLLGIAAGTALEASGADSGLRWFHFHDLVTELLLPILVFIAALMLDWQRLRRILPAVILLAIFAIIVTASIVAAALYISIDHAGFPLAGALIAGVLLAATDPAAATSQSGSSRAGRILEAESLLNDATAVALFSVALSIALSMSASPDHGALALAAVRTFAMEFGGGTLIGVIAGIGGRFAFRRIHRQSTRRWLALLLAMGLYHAALSAHFSGIIAVLAAGLVIGRRAGPDSFLVTVEETATGFLFALAGFTMTWSMFSERWLAILLGIIAAVVGRFCSVTIFLGVAGRWMNPQMQFKEQSAIALFGLRGTVTLALALSLPTELPYWWTIQSIAYGVVLFDALMIAPWAPRLTSRLP